MVSRLLYLCSFVLLLLGTASGQWEQTTLSTTRVRAIVRSGNYLVASTSLGVSRSLDGYTWSPASNGLKFAPGDSLRWGCFDLLTIGGYLFVATDSGVFRSTNDGDTWNLSFSGYCRYLSALPTNALIASVGNGTVVETDDLGEQWTVGNAYPWNGTGIYQANVWSMASLDGSFYSCLQYSLEHGGPVGVFQGASSYGQWHYQSYIVNVYLTGAKGILYALSQFAQLTYSNDAGVTWQSLGKASASSVSNGVQIIGSNFYACSNTGLLRLNETDSTWENITGGIDSPVGGVRSMLIDGNYVYLGTLYHGIMRQSLYEFQGRPADLSVQYQPSWNMVSHSSLDSFRTVSSFLPYAVSDAYTYNKGYQSNTQLDHGKGYWVKLDSALSIPLTSKLHLLDTIAVHKGWNIIGAIGVAYAKSALVTQPDGISLSPLFWYNPVGGGYSQSLTLEPGRAYWVKASNDGNLILDARQK